MCHQFLNHKEQKWNRPWLGCFFPPCAENSTNALVILERHIDTILLWYVNRINAMAKQDWHGKLKFETYFVIPKVLSTINYSSSLLTSPVYFVDEECTCFAACQFTLIFISVYTGITSYPGTLGMRFVIRYLLGECCSITHICWRYYWLVLSLSIPYIYHCKNKVVLAKYLVTTVAWLSYYAMLCWKRIHAVGADT